MGHGKETPRQKMIGMMYLVLTALLALNVSAEVLNAFILIDNSLRATTENTISKNGDIYSKFEAAVKENPAKTKAWKEKADKVGVESNKLYVDIDSLKYLIVRTADGPNGRPDSIQKKDDTNVPGQIMITEKVDGKMRATILKEEIAAYRDFLINLVEDKPENAPLINTLKQNLSTDDIKGQGGDKVPWEVANFEHLPMAGVITLMSKMQADIRNAESDVLSYLFSQIDAGSFKFNKIEAIVNAPTNYVLKGQPYTAQVFIAASDSTVDPVIKLNGGSTLPVKNGKGIFTGNTSTPGVKTWGGVIEMVHPQTKQILKFPFTSTYTVGEAALVVSPTKMNVFYIGVDNPVDVSVPGIDPNKIHVAISNGSIRKKGKGYVVRVKRTGKVYISASIDTESGKKSMGRKEFRVKRVPDPVAYIGDKRKGSVSRGWLAAQSGIKAVLKNFDFNLKFRVVSFKLSYTDKGFTKEKIVKSNSFGTIRSQLRKIPSGKKVYFEDIQAVGPDGSKRDLGTLVLRVK